MAAPAPSKTARRSARQRAVRMFNTLADAIDEERLGARPSGEDVNDLYESLCAQLPVHLHEDLKSARNLWIENGGDGDLKEELLLAEKEWETPNGPEPLSKHGTLSDSSGKAFRLKSKAFMLTFHSLLFVAGVQLWMEFHAWVQDRLQRFGATHYSCTLEESAGSASNNRVHLRCYFSWLGSIPGIDHVSTKEWRFRDICPRVDQNKEHRGP